MAQNKEQLKFMANQTYPIELLYDTPFEGESKYGKYFWDVTMDPLIPKRIKIKP